MKVHFINIGRHHACFTAELESVTYAALLRQVRPHLLSREVSFSFDESGGVVIVGLVRIVGRFRIEKE